MRRKEIEKIEGSGSKHFEIKEPYLELFKKFSELIPTIMNAETRKRPGDEYRLLRKALSELEDDIHDFNKELLNVVGKNVIENTALREMEL